MPKTDDSDMISLSTVKLLMQQQRDDFNSMIATYMKSIEDRLVAVKGEVISLKMSLQYTQNDVEDLKDKDNSVASTEKKVDALETKLDYL